MPVGIALRQRLALGSEWGVAHAAEIVEEVVKATGTLPATARKLQVRNPRSLRAVCADVHRRRGLLSR